MNRIKNTFSTITGKMRGGSGRIFSKFGGQRGVGSAKRFFASNTLVAYVAFLLLMVVFFLIVIRVGTAAMVALAKPNGSPSFYINGGCNKASGCNYARYQTDATIGNTWTQGSCAVSSGGCPKSQCQTVLRSKNGRYGIEFSWSIWLWIDKIGNAPGQAQVKRQHIFSKGSDTVSMNDPTAGGWKPQAGDSTLSKEYQAGMLTPNNGPGLYLDAAKNSLYVVMNTFDMINEEVEINDIPMNKWVNVIIRNEGRILDVYINGTIAIRHQLSSVPKQNYGNVHATKNGGFNGRWSLLHYYDHALNTTEIMNIVRTGPDLRTCTPSIQSPPYLSMQWYFDNPQDVGNATVG
jgi:hypothetical protein